MTENDRDILQEIDAVLDYDAYGRHWTADAGGTHPERRYPPRWPTWQVNIELRIGAVNLALAPWLTATADEVMAAMHAWSEARPAGQLRDQMINLAQVTAAAGGIEAWGDRLHREDPTAIRYRALQARRNRNTGPHRPTRADGRPTRADNRHKPHRTTTH